MNRCGECLWVGPDGECFATGGMPTAPARCRAFEALVDRAAREGAELRRQAEVLATFIACREIRDQRQAEIN